MSGEIQKKFQDFHVHVDTQIRINYSGGVARLAAFVISRIAGEKKLAIKTVGCRIMFFKHNLQGISVLMRG